MAVQSEYSLWSRSPELGVIQACEQLGVAFVPFSPLGRGMFADTLPDPATFGDGDFRKGNPRFVEPNFSHNVGKRCRRFANSAGKGSCLRLLWRLPGAWRKDRTCCPFPAPAHEKHLEQLAAGASLELSPADLAEIARCLPPGFAHGDRYTQAQWPGAERYC